MGWVGKRRHRHRGILVVPRGTSSRSEVDGEGHPRPEEAAREGKRRGERPRPRVWSAEHGRMPSFLSDPGLGAPHKPARRGHWWYVREDLGGWLRRLRSGGGATQRRWAMARESDPRASARVSEERNPAGSDGGGCQPEQGWDLPEGHVGVRWSAGTGPDLRGWGRDGDGGRLGLHA